jgi:predicted acetyltransferase
VTTEEFTYLDPGPLIDGDLCLALSRTYLHHFDQQFAPAYEFTMHRGDATDGVGDIRLRIGDGEELRLYFGHVGFQVFPEARGHHFAERACRLLFPLARRHGLRELWITCNPDNLASRRTCERLGGILVETIALPPHNPMFMRGERQKLRYRIALD